MYLDLYKHLEHLKGKFGEESKVYQKALKATSDYSNVRLFELQGVSRLCSHDANPYVDRIDFTRSGDILVFPHLEDKGILVSSDPPFYLVGQTNEAGFGVVPVVGWEEDMIADKINSEIINKTKGFLRKNPVVDYESEA